MALPDLVGEEDTPAERLLSMSWRKMCSTWRLVTLTFKGVGGTISVKHEGSVMRLRTRISFLAVASMVMMAGVLQGTFEDARFLGGVNDGYERSVIGAYLGILSFGFQGASRLLTPPLSSQDRSPQK